MAKISEYVLEAGMSGEVSPESFFDYYEANGWRVGKNPMKDWKAAVRTWKRNNYGRKDGNSNGSGKARTAGNREIFAELYNEITEANYAGPLRPGGSDK